MGLENAAIVEKSVEEEEPLSYAAQRGLEAMLKLLLAQSDVEADLKDSSGRTLLSFAAAGGHETVVKLPLTSTFLLCLATFLLLLLLEPSACLFSIPAFLLVRSSATACEMLDEGARASASNASGRH